MVQVPVNISWDSPEDAQEFILQIYNNEFNDTMRSIENSLVVLLPYGTYSATLCTVNRCGKICQDYGPMSIVEPSLETSNGEEFSSIIIMHMHGNSVHNFVSFADLDHRFTGIYYTHMMVSIFVWYPFTLTL